MIRRSGDYRTRIQGIDVDNQKANGIFGVNFQFQSCSFKHRLKRHAKLLK